MQSLRWRVVLALFVAALGALYVLPNFAFIREAGLTKVLPNATINLGLDLQGGMHLTLGVDMDKALENSLTLAGRDIRDEAREKGVTVLKPTVTKAHSLEFVLTKAEQKDALEALLKDRYSRVFVVEKTETLPEGRLRYTLGFDPGYRAELQSLTLDQAVKTIRNRIDQFGVAEPDIRPQKADHRIVIQLPGLKERERAIALLGKTALLEFKLTRRDVDMEKAKLKLVPGVEYGVVKDTLPTGAVREIPVVMDKEPVLTGEYIADAHVSFDQQGKAAVAMSFTPRGAQIFEKLTGENVGRELAIVLDGTVYSAPRINERIAGGRASISGDFTPNEARDLAVVLRAGALPAPVNILEERTVGPSLGEESIAKGVNAALLSGAAVAVFMAIYYGLGGMVANFCLLFNVGLILAGLGALGATLTLPGIAGIILTLATAVDANVLIFERIREELRNGLSPLAALAQGYSRATLTILDANVTSIIAAAILYQFGTGPIRGFAVTLCLGIAASMFTAIFVSHIVLDWWIGKKPEAARSI